MAGLINTGFGIIVRDLQNLGVSIGSNIQRDCPDTFVILQTVSLTDINEAVALTLNLNGTRFPISMISTSRRAPPICNKIRFSLAAGKSHA